jgi:hypothetical protein
MIETVCELISTYHRLTLLMMEEELEINRETIPQNLNGRSRKTEDLRWVRSSLFDR